MSTMTSLIVCNALCPRYIVYISRRRSLLTFCKRDDANGPPKYGNTQKLMLKIHTNMTAQQSPESCGCKSTSTTYFCNHEFTRVGLCDDYGLETVSPTTAEPEHHPVEVQIACESICDECAVTILLAQDARTTNVAALRLSERSRYEELLVDIPEAPRLTYMGNLSVYEPADLDIPVLSPERYFTIDWDTVGGPAEILIPTRETSDTYTLPKLKYDSTAPACAAEDKFEDYVIRKGLLPKDHQSKGTCIAANWRPLVPIELITESDHIERPRTGSPEYREAARILSRHNFDLMEWVSAGNAFDLKRVQTIRQTLRSNSILSEVSLDSSVQLPSPLPVAEDSSFTSMTVIPQYNSSTDGVTGITGRPKSVPCNIRADIRSRPHSPSLNQPPPLPQRSTAQKLRYFNSGKPALISILTSVPAQGSLLTPRPSLQSSTWPQIPSTPMIIQGPPAHMFKRQPRRKNDLKYRIKKTVGKGLTTLNDAVFTHHSINGRPLRPESPRQQRSSTPALSLKRHPAKGS